MNKVEAVIVKVNPPNYLIRIKRGKFKHWHDLGQHKETDLAFRRALKSGTVIWRPEIEENSLFLKKNR